MKNKLTDLNDHLFMQLERLNDEDLHGEALEAELRRAKAVTGVAHAAVSNARLALDARKALDEFHDQNTPLPAMIGQDNGKEV